MAANPEGIKALVAEMREVGQHQEVFGDRIHEWAGRLESLTAVAGDAEVVDEEGDAMLCPWRDREGNVIRRGSRMRHPDGTEFTVVHLPHGPNNGRPWRAFYDNGDFMDLGLQIGDRGMATIVRALNTRQAVEGMVMVPREPTAAMVDVAARVVCEAANENPDDIGFFAMDVICETQRKIWAAMLAAAPADAGEG